MTNLEIAERKLERLQKETEGLNHSIRKEHDLIPFGQPNIIGRPDIYKNVKRMYDKQYKLVKETEKQSRRIEMLEKVEEFKESNDLLKDVHVVGKSSYATVGAKTSVNNLDYFNQKLQELEEANEKAKAYNKTKPAIKKATLGAEITKLKRKIAMLEEMAEKDANKKVSDYAQSLIDSGKVNQWKKKPIYYFVKGLRKVAFELNEQGDFVESNCYPAYSEEDKKAVEELLKGEF